MHYRRFFVMFSAVFLAAAASPALAITDTTPPTVGAISPVTAAVDAGTTFSATYSDDISGVQRCQLVLDGTSNLGDMTIGSSMSGTATLSHTFAASGSHTLQAQCVDNFSNWGYGAVTTITVPVPGVVGAVTPTTVTNGVATTFSASYSGFAAPFTVNGCWLVVDGSTVYPAMDLSGGAGSVSGTASKSYTFTSNGAHTIFVSCLENNDGTYRQGANTSITVNAAPSDTTAPTVGAINYTGSLYAGSTATISASYSDSGTGVSYCYVKVDGSRTSPDMTIGSSSGGTATRSIVFFSAGTYQVYVACVDTAGNVGLSPLTTTIVTAAPSSDVTPPVVGSISPTTAVVGASVTVSANYSDSGTGVNQCQLYDGASLLWTSGVFGPSTNGTASVGYSFSTVGTHTLHMQCRDAAGNWGIGANTSVNVTASSSLDTSAPTVGRISVSSAVLGSPITLSASYSDNVGVTQCSLHLTGFTTGSAYLSGSATNGSAYLSWLPTAIGTVTAYFECRDAAGNIGTGANQSITVNASGSVVPGTLVKLRCPAGADVNHPCKAVYFYGSDGRRHAFPNSKVYFTWYADFSGVIEIADSTMASLTLGANVTYRPGVRMVKFTTVNTVYAVTRGGVLRPISSEAVARALYGTNWNRVIDDISDAFYANYRFGAVINSASDYNPTAEMNAVTTVDANF